jgi:hypothetical protein
MVWLESSRKTVIGGAYLPGSGKSSSVAFAKSGQFAFVLAHEPI